MFLKSDYNKNVVNKNITNSLVTHLHLRKWISSPSKITPKVLTNILNFIYLFICQSIDIPIMSKTKSISYKIKISHIVDT